MAKTQAEINEKRRARYHANRAKELEQRRQYREKNKEKISEYLKNWRAVNKEARAEYMREYRAKKDLKTRGGTPSPTKSLKRTTNARKFGSKHQTKASAENKEVSIQGQQVGHSAEGDL